MKSEAMERRDRFESRMRYREPALAALVSMHYPVDGVGRRASISRSRLVVESTDAAALAAVERIARDEFRTWVDRVSDTVIVVRF